MQSVYLAGLVARWGSLELCSLVIVMCVGPTCWAVAVLTSGLGAFTWACRSATTVRSTLTLVAACNRGVVSWFASASVPCGASSWDATFCERVAEKAPPLLLESDRASVRWRMFVETWF